MEDELREVAELWNDFVDSMIEARDLWEAINHLVLEGLSTEEAPVLFQKLISMFGKATFTVGIPRMIDWVRMYSTWEDLIIPLEEETKVEETEEEVVANGR